MAVHHKWLFPPNEKVVFAHLINYLDNGSADTYQNIKIRKEAIFKLIVKPVLHIFVAAKNICKFNFKWEVCKMKVSKIIL